VRRRANFAVHTVTPAHDSIARVPERSHQRCSVVGVALVKIEGEISLRGAGFAIPAQHKMGLVIPEVQSPLCSRQQPRSPHAVKATATHCITACRSSYGGSPHGESCVCVAVMCIVSHPRGSKETTCMESERPASWGAKSVSAVPTLAMGAYVAGCGTRGCTLPHQTITEAVGAKGSTHRGRQACK
jgi:hypothetical protein